MNPLDPLQAKPQAPKPNAEIQEVKGPIDVKASPKDHPVIPKTPHETKTEDFELLNKAIESANNNEVKIIAKGFAKATPSIITTGISCAKKIAKMADATPLVVDGLGSVNALISIILTPIGIAKEWIKWVGAGDKVQDFEQSRLLDEAKSKEFLIGLESLLKKPETTKEDIETFLAGYNISIRGIPLEKPEMLAAFKKECLNDHDLLRKMWRQHTEFEGKNFRERVLKHLESDKTTLQDGIQALSSIGFNIPHWKDKLASKIKELPAIDQQKALNMIEKLPLEVEIDEVNHALKEFIPPLSLEYIITSKKHLIDTLKHDTSMMRTVDAILSTHQARVSEIDKMMKKRQVVEQARSNKLEPAFRESLTRASDYLKTLLIAKTPDKQEKFHQIMIGLRELGIQNLIPHIERNKMTPELKTLKEFLEQDPIPWDSIDEATLRDSARALSSILDSPSAFPHLLKDHVAHHETMSASIRNGLQAMSAAKVKEEKKYYTYTLAEKTVLGVFTVMSSIVTVLGFIATFSGLFTIPGVVAVVFGSIGTALSVGSILGGGLHAHLTAPNRFKEGVFAFRNIRKKLYSIPYGFHKFFLDRSRLKKYNNELAMQIISARMQGRIADEEIELLKPKLSSNVYDLLKKEPTEPAVIEKYEESLNQHKQEMVKIEKELASNFVKYSKAAKKYEKQQLALADAGMKDFTINNPSANHLFAKPKPHTPNIVDALTDMHKATGLDELTEDALQHYTGIDMNALSEKAKLDYNTAKARVELSMKKFYGGTFDEVLESLG